MPTQHHATTVLHVAHRPWTHSLAVLTALLGAAVCLPSQGIADRLYLTNGRHLDGLIASETPDEVVLRVEGGEMRINRQRIKQVRYSTPDQSNAIEAAWKQKYFLHEDYVPPGMTDLAKRMRRLQDQRQAAVSAQRGLYALSAREAQLRAEWDGLRQRLTAAGDELRQRNPSDDVQAYNRCVVDVNQLQNRIVEKRDALDALPGQAQAWRQAITSYRHELSVLQGDVTDGYAGRAGEAVTREQRQFLDRVLKELGQLACEFHTNTTPLLESRYGRLVEATINGAAPGRFVFDTGATIVTLSKQFATAIGLDFEGADRQVELVLANGQTITGQSVMLERVAVGGVSSPNVPAVVLDDPPNKHVDGLLGMSFLGRFQVSIDPGDNRISLTEFAPGGE